MSIEDKVNAIVGRRYMGATTRDKVMYHDLPFPGLNKFKGRRRYTRERFEQIARVVDVKEKNILDLGCSVGGIALGMVEKGAKFVTGIDFDVEGLEVAKEAAKILGYNKKTDFRTATIDLELIKELPEYDIIIWLSQWHHSVRQKGVSYAKELLYEVSKKAKVLVFDAESRTRMTRHATQEDVEKWLRESVIYRKIEKYEPIGGWDKRFLFVCSKPMERRVIFNLGAWNGRRTIRFAKQYDLVVSVEPVIENYKLLVETIIEKRLTNVIPIFAAIASKSGASKIYLDKTTQGHSLYLKRNFTESTLTRVVPTISWDALVDSLRMKHVDFVKVDIEGAEEDLLKGMTKIFPKEMSIEMHNRHGVTNIKNLFRLLEEKGYAIKRKPKSKYVQVKRE